MADLSPDQQRQLLRQGALGFGIAAVGALVVGGFFFQSLFQGSVRFSRTDLGLVNMVASEGASDTENNGHTIFARAGQHIDIRVSITKLDKAKLVVFLTRTGFPMKTLKHEVLRQTGEFSWKIPVAETGLHQLDFDPGRNGDLVFDARWKVEAGP